MKLSVSAWSLKRLLLNRKMSLVEFYKLCKQNDINDVELLDAFLKDEESVLKAKNYLDSLGMKVSCYSISNNFVKASVEERHSEIEKVRTGIRYSRLLGTPLLRIFSGFEPKDNSISYEDGKKMIIECFKECVPLAEENGIIFVLENHNTYTGKSGKIKDMLELIGSKALMLNYDVGNFHLEAEDPVNALNNLVDYVRYVHLKDHMVVPDEHVGRYAKDGKKYYGKIIGEGELPLKKIYNILKENGYNGYLTIEYEGDGEPVDSLIKSIEYVRHIMT